ncbi:MAG: hypothetical protein QM776_07245 [Rhodocyclaceae bacterium]
MRYEDRDWIVVTPRCDLANEGKVATILLAACKDISTEWDELSESKSADKTRKRLMQHSGEPKQHFLFQMRVTASTRKGPWMVQFHDIKALPAAQAIEELTPLRFASLSPLFVPSLVERFGAYFSRIGTPGFSTEESAA